jgi:RNA polymerase sigma-70 factor (ECF subfamily)
MSSGSQTPEAAVANPSSRFATTHWSLILAAGDRKSPHADEALAVLCSAYWSPVYAYIRRLGYPVDQAEDLTQAFFTRLLEKEFLAAVDRGKGRFRAFVMACVRHFLSNEQDRQRAHKRGGGRTFLSFNFADAENRYEQELADNVTPERIYERQWAMILLDQVLNRLRDEWVSAGRGRLFDTLKSVLTGEYRSTRYAAIAAQFGITVGTLKVAVHRLRQRYRELLREEIARGVDDPAEVDEEIRQLFAALS